MYSNKHKFENRKKDPLNRIFQFDERIRRMQMLINHLPENANANRQIHQVDKQTVNNEYNFSYFIFVY